MKILLTGGTGFIGTLLSKELISSGHELTIISRSGTSNEKNIKFISWNQEVLQNAINNSDIVINLAGESIAKKRWTKEQKDLLYKSRIVTTQLLVNAINNSPNKPKKLISTSAVGIYGDRGDEKLTEDSSSGSGFLTNVCRDWEAEVKKAKTSIIILRLGVVLGKGGGALEKIILPFKMFVGGPLGSGNQYMSWIAVDDVIGLIKFAIENASVSGILNVTSPNPVTNKEFSNVLGKILHRPSFMPVPDFALKLLLGEMSELLLSSQRVLPERAMELGYKFRYADLEKALGHINPNLKSLLI